MSKRKLRPVIDGDYWLIGGNPHLGELQGLPPHHTLRPDLPPQECVDHHVFQSEDGQWHLWGCIRNSAVGRLLYHWRSDDLTNWDWEKTGEIIRADRASGECINDWLGQEWLQSPFVIKEDGTYYMFYGGHATGHDAQGNPIPAEASLQGRTIETEGQICLMTSADGRNWQRHRNAEGGSAVFTGPGETRDPCLIKIDGLWYLYYAGYTLEDGVEIPAYYARTSTDLINWSDLTRVHYDLSDTFGGGRWNTECPHVVKREGYYYLFRTEYYTTARTHVFRSENPLDFGKGDASGKYVGMIQAAAPEIMVDVDGQEYISSNHDPVGGTMLAKLKWEETE